MLPASFSAREREFLYSERAPLLISLFSLQIRRAERTESLEGKLSEAPPTFSAVHAAGYRRARNLFKRPARPGATS